MTPRGIILSDLDGTFIDDRYVPVLSPRELESVRSGWRVIWVTSRTADEIRWLQDRWDHRDDAIAENGGVCLTFSSETARAMERAEPRDDGFVCIVGDDASHTKRMVRETFAANGMHISTFDELPAAELAHRAGYTIEDAHRAQARRASVVLVDVDLSTGTAQQALATLAHGGFHISTGHRWTTVVGHADKGTTSLRWLDAVGNSLPVVAIGDGDNDVPLLGAVKHRFVIRRASGGHHPALARLDGARLLDAVGPAGWREMLDLIDRDTELT